jgi:hypothetical protein
MEKTPIHKKVAAFAVALALSVGVFGGVSLETAHAESSSSHSSSLSSMSEANLIAMLQDLIKLLEARLQALIDARANGTPTVPVKHHSNDDDCATSTDNGLTELEADVFTNETVIKIELDGKKQVFTTTATGRGEIEDAILAEFTTLKASEVSDMLVIDREDRASRASDKELGSFGSDSSSSCDDDSDEDSDDDDDDNRGHGNDDDEDDHSGHGRGGDDDEDDD